jgi:hypothetical protein
LSKLASDYISRFLQSFPRQQTAPLALQFTLAYDQCVSSDLKQCPPLPEEVAEAYILGTLTEAQTAAFEAHFLACNHCTGVLQQVSEYVDAMRAAARTAPRVRAANPAAR